MIMQTDRWGIKFICVNLIGRDYPRTVNRPMQTNTGQSQGTLPIPPGQAENHRSATGTEQ